MSGAFSFSTVNWRSTVRAVVKTVSRRAIRKSNKLINEFSLQLYESKLFFRGTGRVAPPRE